MITVRHGSRLGPWLHERRRWALWVALGAAAVIGLYLALLPNGDMVGNRVDNVTEACAAALAALGAAVAARAGHGSRRLAWSAMALGTLAWALGQLLVTGYQWDGGGQPFPGLPDVGFLLFPIGCLTCLAFLARSIDRTSPFHRRLLDGAIITVALLVAGWATSIGQALTAHQGSLFASVVAVIYPLSDVALCATALMLLGRAGRRRPVFTLIAFGLLGLTISDTAYTYLITVQDYAPWQWLDSFWTAGFLVLAVAAVFDADRQPVENLVPVTAADATVSAWQVALPYIPLGLAACVLLARLADHAGLDRTSAIGAVALVVLVLARQFVALIEVRRLTATVTHQALHDPLTGLANRALFGDRLEHAVAAYHGELRPCAVVLVDLDGFKTINDSLGHPVGDRGLTEVAARLRACTRPMETVARLGGDEFAVLVEGTSVDPLDLALNIQSALRPVFRVDGHVVRFRASIGIACAEISTDPDGVELLRRADIALYAAKSAGKDTVREYSALAESAYALMGIRTDLSEAIDRREIGVAYQPIVELRTGRVMAVEALATWTHDDLGLITADAFIPVAERTGLIRDLTALVLDAALETASAWRAYPEFADVPVSVNITPGLLADPTLLTGLQTAVASHGLSPTALMVEITETAPFEDMAATACVVASLRNAGFSVALDDFGAGSTSVSYLHQLPTNIVKIDRCLVTSESLVPDGIVATIIRLCGALHRTTVIEGVETAEQRELLVNLGAELAQGYLFARPMPSEVLLENLLTSPSFGARTNQTATAGRQQPDSSGVSRSAAI